MNINELENKIYWYKAECISVIDGDTLEFFIDLGLKVKIKERVRLAGINSAEIYGVKKESEEYAKGMATKRRVEELIASGSVWVNTIRDKSEKYGRYLAEVYVLRPDGTVISLTETLLAEGLVTKYE